MLRKTSAPFLCAFLFAAALPSYAALIKVAPSIQSVSAGSTFSVAIDISGLSSDTAFGAYDVTLAFNSSVLSFTQAVFGDPILGDQFDLAQRGLNFPLATIGNGNVNLIEFSFDDSATLNFRQASSFTLATLSLTTLETGTSPLSLIVNRLSDRDGKAITAFSTQNSSATVVGVSLPAAVWLMLTGCVGMLFVHRQRRFR